MQSDQMTLFDREAAASEKFIVRKATCKIAADRLCPEVSKLAKGRSRGWIIQPNQDNQNRINTSASKWILHKKA